MAKRNDKPESHSAAKFPYHRQLKVRKGHYVYHYQGKAFQKAPYPAPVPFILIKGYWLSQANFPVGTVLQVTIHPGQIILSASSGG